MIYKLLILHSFCVQMKFYVGVFADRYAGSTLNLSNKYLGLTPHNISKILNIWGNITLHLFGRSCENSNPFCFNFSIYFINETALIYEFGAIFIDKLLLLYVKTQNY